MALTIIPAAEKSATMPKIDIPQTNFARPELAPPAIEKNVTRIKLKIPRRTMPAPADHIDHATHDSPKQLGDPDATHSMSFTKNLSTAPKSSCRDFAQELENLYRAIRDPTPSRINAIALALELDIQDVIIWFKNRCVRTHAYFKTFFSFTPVKHRKIQEKAAKGQTTPAPARAW